MDKVCSSWSLAGLFVLINQPRQYYRLKYDHSLRSTARDADEEAQQSFKFAEENFAPLYFIRSYPSDKKKIEMSFDLTNYQPQVRFFFFFSSQ